MRTHDVSRSYRCTILFGGALLLGGCTELKVLPAPPGPIEGIAYWLPKRTFVITVAYELRACTASQDQVTLSVAKTADVAANLLPDERERYYIPYSVLRNWWKDMNITVESQENGTLKGVTSIVTDRTGDAISQALTAAVKISSYGVARTKGEDLRGQSVERGRDAAACDADRQKDIETVKTLRAKTSPTEDEKVRLAQALANLTYKEAITWTPRKPKSGEPEADPYVASLIVEPQGLVGPDSGRWARIPGATPEGLRTEIQVVVFGKVMPDPPKRPEGFLVRQGLPATLRVCDGRCRLPTSDPDSGVAWSDETNVFKTFSAVVPQFGDYIGLPFRNRPFEVQTLTIALGAEGGIVKMGLQSNATGVAALQSLNANLDTVANAKAAADKRAADAAAAAQNARQAHASQVAADNNAIAQCLAAQKAVRDAGGNVTGICQ